jgi:hypothetical protein
MRTRSRLTQGRWRNIERKRQAPQLSTPTARVSKYNDNKTRKTNPAAQQTDRVELRSPPLIERSTTCKACLPRGIIHCDEQFKHLSSNQVYQDENNNKSHDTKCPQTTHMPVTHTNFQCPTPASCSAVGSLSAGSCAKPLTRHVFPRPRPPVRLVGAT